MKRIISISAAVLIGVISPLYAAEKYEDKIRNKPCPECYIMHPEITPKDDKGSRTRDPETLSSVKTCGECHDASYINSHNMHFTEKVKAGCIECHVEGSRINLSPDSFTPAGTIKKNSIMIRAPKNENCSYCHGIIGEGKAPVYIPDDYSSAAEYKAGGKSYNLTRNTGEIISPQNISESLFNIKGRSKLSHAWDTHSQREVFCIACHFTANDPKRNEAKKSDLAYLSNDPRRVYSLSRYLYRPDHKLVTAGCKSCHEPEKVHSFLRYKKRHFEVLACQSCHTPKLYGPALKYVDETVLTEYGTPVMAYRGIDHPGENLNTAFLSGYEPYLLSYKSARGSGSGVLKKGISPFNPVTYFRWKDGTGNYVTAETLKKVLLNGSVYTGDMVKLLDKNGDGRLGNDETVLDTGVKADAVKSKLEAAGIKGAVIVAEVVPYSVNHGIADVKTVSQDCGKCHGTGSRFGENIDLAGGAVPVSVPASGMISYEDRVYYLNGSIETGSSGTFVVKEAIVKNHYIFGYSRVGWLNVLGFAIFILTILGIAVHGILRYLSSKNAAHEETSTESVYMYTFYERIWHWTMAFSIIMLIISGLEIHFTGRFSLFGFTGSIDIHNAFALIVSANAGLSLFYYAATGEIRRFFRISRGFGKETIAQGIYYIYGIFKGTPHPVEKTPERRYNPLQQVTYVMLLNVLFPFQILTGIMMWIVSVSPSFAEAAGGLSYLAPMHNFAAWLFITFLVMHMYLVTTGHTLLSNLRGMITGYEDIEVSRISGDVVREELLKVNLRDIVNNIREILKRI